MHIQHELTKIDGLLLSSVLHLLFLQMEFGVVLGLVQTAHRPQFSVRRHPSQLKQRFRLGRFALGGNGIRG